MSRRQRYDYLLSALPGVEALGSVPPMSKQDLLERVRASNGPVDSVECLLLGDDLIQHSALLAGEIQPNQAELAVLDLSSEGAGAALPKGLVWDSGEEGRASERVAVDGLWSRYFQYAQNLATRVGSPFVRSWVGFEVGMRNALCIARAHALELDPTSYLVAPHLAQTEADYATALTAWSAASDPLDALEILDKCRWDWLQEYGRWYSFGADEIEAYTVQLILLHRWRRMGRE